MQQYLLIIGATIFGILGSAHLIFTFYGSKFEAKDRAVTQAMKETSPRISVDTTMWKAWIGFNGSHSLGAMLFAAIYVPLAGMQLSLIQQSIWFSILPIVVGLSYLLLAYRYWFKVPFWGIFVANMCFIIAALINFIDL